MKMIGNVSDWLSYAGGALIKVADSAGSTVSENNKTCDKKKLFSFLKSSRRDQEGIPPLKDNDTLLTETPAKANQCKQQFQSVFTKKIPTFPFTSSPNERTGPS